MELPRTPAPRLVAPRLVVASVVAASGLLLAACSGAAQPAAPAPSTTASAPAPAPPSTTTQSASSSSSAATGGAGCAPTGQEVPAGAAVAATADLDHDGRADELWLADSTASSTGALERRLGVRTASGAVFSTTYTSASPQGTTAIGQRLDASTSVVLLSDGRQVPLYAVVSGSGGGACQLVPSTNEQGQQYTFDLGFTGYGTGVACVPADGSGTTDPDADLALYGLLVRGGDAEGDLPVIERTRIDLSDGGRQARNGPTDAPAELQGINPEGPQVAAARQVRCGDQGPDTAVAEPAS